MKPSDEEMLAELRAARRDRDRLADEIRAWMASEAKAFRLRRNADAPMWHDYERALLRINIAVNALTESDDDAARAAAGGGS